MVYLLTKKGLVLVVLMTDGESVGRDDSEET